MDPFYGDSLLFWGAFLEWFAYMASETGNYGLENWEA